MPLGTPEEQSATLENTESANQEQPQTVDWEKRFKDTQASYTKSRQELAALKAEIEALKQPTQLSDEEKDKLEDLKYTDPDEWRKRVNTIEQEHSQRVDQKRQELTELEKRQMAFEDFAHSHPDVVINDDVIAYDVPKRITAKLEKGEITFEAYLNEVYEYLKAPKVIGDGNKALASQPDLSKLGGNSAASASATAADIVQSYKNEIY